jgi:hypothetical protein
MQEMSDPHFTPADDRFHFDVMSDRWWETETSWFSFYNSERRMGGWLYVMVRPNIGTVAGGAWVWDDTAHLPWEVLYSANYTALRLAREQNLDDITLRTGVSIRVIEPMTSYQLGYEDGDQLSVSLRFDAMMPPQPMQTTGSGFGHAAHFDQFGHVTGNITLRGERIDINCYSARDRSWGPRPEHRPRRTAYVTGAAANVGFLTVTNPNVPGDPSAYGFHFRENKVRRFTAGSRITERDLSTGWISRISVSAVDEDGFTFAVEGRPVSRIIINRHTFIDINSLICWTFGTGEIGWGEDQDCWPISEWAKFRRESSKSSLIASRIGNS